jgi:hypothetical protein
MLLRTGCGRAETVIEGPEEQYMSAVDTLLAVC